MSPQPHDTAAADAPPPQPIERIGMWDQERDSPGLYALLYAAAMLAGLLGHHVIGWIARLWGAA